MCRASYIQVLTWTRSGKLYYKPNPQRSCCPHYTLRYGYLLIVYYHGKLTHLGLRLPLSSQKRIRERPSIAGTSLCWARSISGKLPGYVLDQKSKLSIGACILEDVSLIHPERRNDAKPTSTSLRLSTKPNTLTSNVQSTQRPKNQ